MRLKLVSRILLCICTFAVGSVGLTACSGDDDDNEGTNAGTTTPEGEDTEDTNEGTQQEEDTGTGTGEDALCNYPECTAFDGWGNNSTIALGDTVSDWQMSGYFDQDCDGTIDEVEADFSLEDIRCTGAHAAIVIVGGLL